VLRSIKYLALSNRLYLRLENAFLLLVSRTSGLIVFLSPIRESLITHKPDGFSTSSLRYRYSHNKKKSKLKDSLANRNSAGKARPFPQLKNGYNHSWASTSRKLKPASAFQILVRYRTVSAVPDLFRHR
jgi:hypothetical protein